MAAEQRIQLPSAHLFDILPALHEILARIDHTDTPADNTTHYTNVQPLDPKDLPREVLVLKTMMRRGLREIEQLPDIERSVDEQEEEIAELEERIKKQSEGMKTLATGARGAMDKLR